ncbi:hypothetical protein Vadar_033984 [Vaccinium darrowii]|uniref:Uncharacterized protein n=1 Tax=Vaccinium darrowii TaxID=229202 RepID=A0ACB7X6G0_9ERIC|nr:hypothetical protein Vadar_033984 [Vaccinium darrowii]
MVAVGDVQNVLENSQDKSNTLSNPSKGPRRGRPPAKRKQSMAEQIIRKSAKLNKTVQCRRCKANVIPDVDGLNMLTQESANTNVHHGGIFVVDRGTKSYMGGQISYSDYWDVDKVSLLELDEIGKKLGFTKTIEFYYKVLNNGVFKILQNDNDILDMVKCIKDGKIDIFLVTPTSTVDGLEDMDVGNGTVGPSQRLESP